jgi:hypothetical protein
MYSPRQSVRNYIWNVSDGTIPHLEFGYELRARYPKDEIKNCFVAFLTFTSILWVVGPRFESTHHPYILGILASLSVFGWLGSGMWTCMSIGSFIRGRLELKAFYEEFPKMLDERQSRKEVT